MPSSSENDADMVIVAKTVDPVVVNRTYRYTHLTPGTKVLVTVSSPRSAVADAIIARLTAAGCKVTILEDAESSGNVGHVVAGDGAVEMIKGTVSSKADCERAVEGQAVVVHVPCHAGGGDVSASEAAKQVVEGTKNMLRAATDAAVKCFVFVSSARYVNLQAHLVHHTVQYNNVEIRRVPSSCGFFFEKGFKGRTNQPFWG